MVFGFCFEPPSETTFALILPQVLDRQCENDIVESPGKHWCSDKSADSNCLSHRPQLFVQPTGVTRENQSSVHCVLYSNSLLTLCLYIQLKFQLLKKRRLLLHSDIVTWQLPLHYYFSKLVTICDYIISPVLGKISVKKFLQWTWQPLSSVM